MKTKERVLLLASEHEYITSPDVQQLLGWRIEQAGILLSRLRMNGFLNRKRMKKEKGGKKYKYFLSKKGERKVNEIKKIYSR